MACAETKCLPTWPTSGGGPEQRALQLGRWSTRPRPTSTRPRPASTRPRPASARPRPASTSSHALDREVVSQRGHVAARVDHAMTRAPSHAASRCARCSASRAGSRRRAGCCCPGTAGTLMSCLEHGAAFFWPSAIHVVNIVNVFVPVPAFVPVPVPVFVPAAAQAQPHLRDIRRPAAA